MGNKHSEETKLKISKNNVGMKGKNIPTNQKLSESHTGKPSGRKGKTLSDEHKRKISESLKKRRKF